jgi:anti-sigma regulatory factor (Ser/Thr protein kinase)
MTSVSGWTVRHAALLYGSAEELLAAAVPFLAAGLGDGDAVVLACRPEHTALLADALGHDDRILALDREGVYTRSANAVATYRRVVHRGVAAGALAVRLIGEVPVDPRPQGWADWHRYEAIFNVALAPLPVASVCAYDIRELTEPIGDGVEQTHPALLTAAGHRPNDRFVEPSIVLRRITATPADPVDHTPPTLSAPDLADVTRLPELRAQLRTMLTGASWQEQLRSDFAAAVCEVLLNAYRHGRPPVAVRLWVTPTQLVCTVTDCGDGFDDPLAGYAPPDYGPRAVGAGLWLVRQACDVLEAARTPTGFTARLTTFLPGSDAARSTDSGTAGAEPASVRVERARASAKELARRFPLGASDLVGDDGAASRG